MYVSAFIFQIVKEQELVLIKVLVGSPRELAPNGSLSKN